MKIKSVKVLSLMIAAIGVVPSRAITILDFDNAHIIGQDPPVSAAATLDSLVHVSNRLTSSGFDLAGQTALLFDSLRGKLTYANSRRVVDAGGVRSGGTISGVSGFEYLVVKYSGLHGESYIFDITGLSGDVQVPRTDPKGLKYSDYCLFNVASSSQVLVGGNTALLLGLGFAAIGLL